MKKRRKKLKIVSFLLSISLLVTAFTPFTVFADEPAKEQLSDSSQLWTPEQEEKLKEKSDDPILPIILSEDISRRGEYEKHFLCDDGSYIAVTYPDPVHEMNDGVWENIEFELSDTQSRISSNDGSNCFSLAKSSSAQENELVKIIAGEYQVSWTVEAKKAHTTTDNRLKAQKATESKTLTTVQKLSTSEAVLKANWELKEQGNEKDTKTKLSELLNKKTNAKEELKKYSSNIWSLEENILIDNTNAEIEAMNRSKIAEVHFATSMVEYPQALGEGTCLRYMVTPEKLKEEVVINSANALEAYCVKMNTAGLIAVADEEGGIILKNDEGQNVLNIAPPMLYDAADEISRAVTVTLQQDENSCVITYMPDKEWLQATERVYPVVIDPTVTSVSIAQTNQIDNYVYNGQSSVLDDNDGTLYVGCYSRSGVAREHRTFWRLNTLPTIPSGGSITSASFNIRLKNGTSSMDPIGLYKAGGSWNSDQLTWNNMPSTSTYLGQISTVPAATEKWLTYSGSAVTSAVSGWYSGTNNGFILKYNECLNDYNTFYSSDYRPSGSTSYIPYVSINYAYISYTTLSQETPASGNITQGSEYWYTFTPTECDKTYAFYTTGSTDTYGELYQGSTLLDSDDDDGDGNNFCIIHGLVCGTQYRLKVRGYSTNTTGSYLVMVKKIEPFNYVSTSYNSYLALKCAEYAMLAYDEIILTSTGYKDTGTRQSIPIPTQLNTKLDQDHFDNIFNFNYDDDDSVTTSCHNVSYTLAQKPIAFNGQARTLVAIIIRGTDGIEWKGNMDMTGSTYNASINNHYSFDAAATDLQTNSTKGLANYLLDHGITNPVYLITGHSRGAAVANLVANTLTSSVGASDVFAYTFATPNVTKVPNTSRTNIRNFVFNDDFVPQVPLTNWGYGKHGITYTQTAGTLYTNNVSTFKSDVDTFLSDSNRGNANFNLTMTELLLSHVYHNWETVQSFYETNRNTAANGSQTLYTFFRNIVAPAAMGDGVAGYKLLCETDSATYTYYTTIARYFVSGSNAIFFGVDYIYDTHSPFTYYSAVKYGLFI